MTFTYAGTLATNLDKVRFYIGDKVASSGPRPAGGNFTDEELGGLITAEGSWQRAVAGAFEALAAEWGTSTDITLGPRSESLSQVAARYATQAGEWRKKYGTAGRAGSRYPTRVDGYSSDIASDEV